MTELEEQRQKYLHMTTSPVRPLVRRLFVPTVITMLITSVYNLVDTFFVGRLGSSATGAVGAIFSVMAVIQAMGFGFGHGAGNYVSRKLGEQDVEEAQRMATVGMGSSFLTGLLVMVLGLALLSPLVSLLGVTPTIRPYAEEYLRFILLGAPFFGASLTMNNLLRLQGNAQFAMVGITLGAVLNACLDPLLIFGLDMGIRGAGLSTLVSQVVSFAVLLAGNERSDAVKLRPAAFRPSRRRYLAIVQGGMPSVGRQGTRCLGIVVLNHAMKIFGDEVYAALTIVIRLANLLFAVAIGIGQGFQPVCGFNFGARLHGRVLQAYHYTQRLAVALMVVLCAVLFGFAPQVVSWFTEDGYVVEVATVALRWQCVAIPFMSYANIVSMFFQNINHFRKAFLIAIGRDGLFFLPAVVLLPRVAGLAGLVLAQPVADGLTFLTALALVIPTLRHLQRGANEAGRERR